MTTFVRLIRLRQWVKNSLVFAAIIFSQHYSSLNDWLSSLYAFLAFCLAASAVYMINDCLDLELDRFHPVKKYRPIAAGEIKPGTAIIMAILFSLISLAIGWYINLTAMLILAGYIIVMILYSLWLKHFLLIDVFLIATGLTARAVMGAVSIEVTISKWLLVCTFFIALMLALAKRRQEIARVGDLESDKIRRSLAKAPPLKVWDQWIMMMAGVTILAYTLYAMDPVTVQKVGSQRLLFTMPFVLFAVLRYQIAIYSNDLGEDPTETLLGDRWILASVLGWIVVVMLVVGNII